MFSAATKTDGASTAANYIEDVFSTCLYTGTGAAQSINNGIGLGNSATNNSSISLNASTPAYLTFSSQVSLSGDFCIQAWLYPNSLTGTRLLFSSTSDTNVQFPRIQENGGIYCYANGTEILSGAAASALTAGRWTHLAMTRSGSTFRAFVDGVLYDSATYSGTFNLGVLGVFFFSGSLFSTTYAFDGLISNAQIVTGSAIYTADFTPPQNILSGGAVLLGAGATPLADTSGTGKTVTQFGSPAASSSGPWAIGANKGGLVWLKSRSVAQTHMLYTKELGVQALCSNNTNGLGGFASAENLSSYNTNGFSLLSTASRSNTNGDTYTSWTFCEQAKFFDVVTYTGNNSSQTINHNLGSVPGCIIVKCVGGADPWFVYHRSLGTSQYLILNSTDGSQSSSGFWGSVTSTSFGTTAALNANGLQYVAYLFAHDAGGFGLSGTDNVITCGSYTGTGGANTVTLGYEPQWLLVKKTNVQDSTSFWSINDNMRGGLNANGNASQLKPNSTEAEDDLGGVTTLPAATATGFTIGNAGGYNASGATYIYIAIRRGPMKVPTTGTSVFQPVVYTGTNVDNRLVNTTILADMILARQRNSTTLDGMVAGDRLRGNQYFLTGSTAAGVTDADSLMTPTVGYGNSFSAMNGFGVGNDATSQLNASTVASNQVVETFQRAPGFFDVVTYTGTGVARTISHNLGAVPQMIWVKRVSTTGSAVVYSSTVGPTVYWDLSGATNFTVASSYWNDTAPTSSVFSVGTAAEVNSSGATFVAYLFGSVTGVSDVSYYVGKGVGTANQVDCGFAAGARFILIKSLLETTSVPWYVYDTARGIIAGNDPYLVLDNTTAEVTSTDYVDTNASGFELSTTAPISLNGSYANEWIQQGSVAGTADINDIIYANGYWVFGDSGANVRYSATGYSWTTVAGVVSGGVDGVAFGNGLYVAVGSGGRISTSPDLTTWTTRTSGTASNLTSVDYAFGKYWVCGVSGTVVSSTDGVTWSTVSIGTAQTLNSVRLLNGNLVFAGNNGAMVTSSNGTTFTVQSTGGATDDYYGITFGNNLYVAVGNTGVIRTSPDLVTWTSRSAGALSGNNIRGVTWTGNRYVAVATAGENGFSTDGITWSTGAAAGTNPLLCVAFGNDICILGNGDGDVYVSDPRFMYIAIA